MLPENPSAAFREFIAQMREFWAQVQDVWTTAFFGIDVGTVLGAIFIFLFFLALRGLFTRIVLARLHRFAQRSDSRLDDDVVSALADPVRFIWVVLGAYFTVAYLPLTDAPALFAGRLVRSLIAFTIFWFLYNAARAITGYLGVLKRVLTEAMTDWLVKALKAAILFVGAATILEVWGIAVAPLLAGLGLFGVAVALGAQDLFKNLISGLLILVEQRFSKGDWVHVDGVVEGVVEVIGFRSTLVRRFDKAPVYVPNGALSDNAVTNFSRMSYRRIYWKIGVTYDTSIDQLRTVRDGIEAYIKDSGYFADASQAPLFVHIDSFGASSIDIMVYCFTRTTVWAEWLAIKEALAYAVKDIVESAGTGFAFPSQSVYIETLPAPPGPALGGSAPETYLPPQGGTTG